jgi:hypothetical protein
VSGKCGDSMSVIVEQNGIEKVLKGSVDDFRVVRANLTGGNRVTTGRSPIDVRELRTTCDLSDRPDAGRGGLQDESGPHRAARCRATLRSSAASTHKVVETRRAQISAA